MLALQLYLYQTFQRFLDVTKYIWADTWADQTLKIDFLPYLTYYL